MFSFYDERSKLKKALKVIEYEKMMETDEINIDEAAWFAEAKTEIDNLIALSKCEHVLRMEDYNLDYDYNCIYLVTELAKSNLFEHISVTEEFPVSEIMKVMFSLLAGLAFAHEQGIVHRDIKPENVLLTYSGSYLICDWGIARKMKKAGTQTHNFEAKGTRLYTPPELFKVAYGQTNQANLFKSDAYSAGLLFLVCLGCPEDELQFIDRFDEDMHSLKLKNIMKKFVLPKFPEVETLIGKITQFDPKARIDVVEALKMLESIRVARNPANPSSFYGDGDTKPLVPRRWVKYIYVYIL